MMILFFYALISYIFCRQNFYNLTKTTHAVFGHTCIFSAGNHQKKNQNNETTCGSLFLLKYCLTNVCRAFLIQCQLLPLI